MKHLLRCSLFMAVTFTTYAQVGINTTDPQAMLDVNGSMRLQNITDEDLRGDKILANQILGISENGDLVRVTLDDNVYLENNVIKANTTYMNVGSIPALGTGDQHNVDLVIWPGGANKGKTVIQMMNGGLGTSIDITGIDVSGFSSPAAADGTTVWLYAFDNDLRLRIEDAGSDPENRILSTSAGTIVIPQYGMVRLMYDGTTQRWVIMTR